MRGTNSCEGTCPERATGLGQAWDPPRLKPSLRGHKYGSKFFSDSPVEGGSAHRA